MPNKILFTTALIAASALSMTVQAQESSIILTSTAIGQNFDYPTGTEEIETAVGELDVVVETAVFFKNTELIGFDTLDGQTFFGVLAPIRMRYKANEKVTFEVGAVLGQNFGDDDGLDIIEPLVRIAVEPTEDVHIIAGTLLPTHASHQALFDDTNKFQDLAEQGFQFRVNKNYFKQDSWINWRIREGDIRAEEFEIGNVSQVRLFDDVLRLDGQFHYAHAGGQISESRRVDDNYAGLLGASVGVGNALGWDTIEDVRLRGAAIFSSENTKDAPSTDGDGWEVGANVDLRVSDSTLVRLDASYYSGEDLNAQRGDALYRFDDYGQLGAAAVWNFGPNMNIEFGAAYQRSDGPGTGEGDLDNWTANINFTYGTAFLTNAFKARR